MIVILIQNHSDMIRLRWNLQNWPWSSTRNSLKMNMSNDMSTWVNVFSEGMEVYPVLFCFCFVLFFKLLRKWVNESNMQQTNKTVYWLNCNLLLLSMGYKFKFWDPGCAEASQFREKFWSSLWFLEQHVKRHWQRVPAYWLFPTP